MKPAADKMAEVVVGQPLQLRDCDGKEATASMFRGQIRIGMMM
jgi:hypothetical protein